MRSPVVIALVVGWGACLRGSGACAAREPARASTNAGVRGQRRTTEILISGMMASRRERITMEVVHACAKTDRALHPERIAGWRDERWRRPGHLVAVEPAA